MRFKKYYETPILAAVLNKLYKLGVPETGRDDLVAVLGTGIPKVTFTGNTLADELRINLAIPVTAAGKVEPDGRPRRRQRRLPERPPADRRRRRHRGAGGRRLPQGQEGAPRRRRRRQRRGEPRPLPLPRSPARGLREREGDRSSKRIWEGPLCGGALPPPPTDMRTRLLIALALVVGVAAGALYGGVFRDSDFPRVRRARRVAVGGGLQGRLLARQEHRRPRRRPPVAPAREPEGRALLRPPRARLRAARPRDGRPLLVPEGGGRAPPRARARPQGFDRGERTRLARPLPPPVRARPSPSANRRAGSTPIPRSRGA